jgi:hypothetical protein
MNEEESSSGTNNVNTRTYSDTPFPGFATDCIHAGQKPDPHSGINI